jgi:hypothetical protein
VFGVLGPPGVDVDLAAGRAPWPVVEHLAAQLGIEGPTG